ncbi:MAG TPA: efflux RND transporter periplasmic adaptor subunit [Candidatus Nitrosocosmicus sp.]|nr:efflux RND transporter periplasmic adaptor subunit [Candidatus Nitrosocosmicus sp.]
MKKLIALILIPIFLFAGCSKKAVTTTAQPVEKVAYIKTAVVKTMDLDNTLNLPGTAQPKDSAVITAKVSGTVKAVMVDIGSPVKEGALLCKIDDTIYRLQYEKADAAVRNAKLTLESLKDYTADSKLQPQKIEMAQTLYNTAKLDYENKEKSYNRMKELYNAGSVSKSEYEGVETFYGLAKEQYESAQSSLRQAERGWRYDVKGAEIGLKVAENDYKMSKENLQYTDVASPIEGIVSSKNISVGENIAPGAMIFSVVNIDNLYLESGISEKDISFVRIGQAVDVSVDALPGKSFRGLVTGISPALDMQSKTYPIKVEIKNENQSIKAGMFGNMKIILESHKNALTVPKEAVLVDHGSYYVYIVKDGKAVKRVVKLGYSNENQYEIIQGVKIGEKVVVVGNSDLEDGEKVLEK